LGTPAVGKEMEGPSGLQRPWWIRWYLVTVVLAGLLAALSVFGRGPTQTETYADFFGNWGEPISRHTNGVFRLVSDAFIAEHVAWDVVTLVLVAPLLWMAASAVERGSMRARVAAVGGLIAILLQQRAYLGTWATNSPAAFLSLLVLVLAFFGSVRVAREIDARSLADDLSLVSSRPVRPVASAELGTLLVVFLLLFGRLLLDLAYLSTLGGTLPTSAAVEQTLVGLPVSGWSLTMIVAVLAFLLLRRNVLGEMLAATLLVTTAVLGLGNVVMVIAAWVVSGTSRPLALLVASAVTAGSGGGLWVAERRLTAAESAAALHASYGPGAQTSRL
jgi:hypothetical protein